MPGVEDLFLLLRRLALCLGGFALDLDALQQHARDW
jgi:hypothetical protein